MPTAGSLFSGQDSDLPPPWPVGTKKLSCLRPSSSKTLPIESPDTRSDHGFELATPPSSSRVKGIAWRQSGAPTPGVAINIDDNKEKMKNNLQRRIVRKKNEVPTQEEPCSSATPFLPCIDWLREELSCAICLEICFEPNTTHCGHSFCKKCLKSAADKCGKKCPKCRQLIGNGGPAP